MGGTVCSRFERRALAWTWPLSIARPSRATSRPFSRHGGAFGIDKPKREQVAFIAGYSPTSGGFYNLLGGLRTMGLLDYPSGGLVSLSEDGQARADAPAVAPTRDAFHTHVRGKLSGSQLRVFDPILGAWPQEIASEAVADQAGYSSSSGGFFNLRGSLRTLGLIDYPSSGQCRAADWLFP
jgi:hypothetical protein